MIGACNRRLWDGRVNVKPAVSGNLSSELSVSVLYLLTWDPNGKMACSAASEIFQCAH